MTRSQLPLILVTCNNHVVEGTPAQVVKNPYLSALIEVTGATPLLIPAHEPLVSLKKLAGKVDGILLTGSRAHVSPDLYGAEREFDESYLDDQRDKTALTLVRDALEMDIPLLAICRGFQEMNVALGGSLHQSICDVEGKNDHRAPQDMPLEEAYKLQAHAVQRLNGGLFERIGIPETFRVNSIHAQGVDRIAEGLNVEALSEDGIVEALSVKGRKFAVGVQWHPEGDYRENVASRKLFEAFRDAVTV